MSRNLNSFDCGGISDDAEDLYSDEEEGSYTGSLSDKNIPSAADRRAHHNALERKRRDHIKDSFSSLRDSVPSLQGEKITASRAQILKKAAEYIAFMRKKNTNVQQDIDHLAKQNKTLQDQIRKMEKTNPGSSGMTSQQLSALFANDPDVSTSYDVSENSNESSNSGIGVNGSRMASGSGSVSTVGSNGSHVANTSVTPTVSIVNTAGNGLHHHESNGTNNNANILIHTNNNKTIGGTPLLNGAVSVRPVTVKNGTSKIIVQNPQHKNASHVIHVTTTTPGTGAVNGMVASNINNISTGTPIIISANPSSVPMGSTNGTINVIKGGGAISLAQMSNGLRTLVVQSASGTPSAVTSSPNIHILGIPANNNYSKPMKKIKISTDSESIISASTGTASNGNNTTVTSVSS